MKTLTTKPLRKLPSLETMKILDASRYLERVAGVSHQAKGTPLQFWERVLRWRVREFTKYVNGCKLVDYEEALCVKKVVP